MSIPLFEKTAAVKAAAAREGFDACHIAQAGDADPDDNLGEWLRRGYHARMDWMDRTRDLRQDVHKKLPGAASVIVLARNYYQPDPPRPPATGRVARYAWGRDYHNALRKPLKRLARFLENLEPGATCYAAVDSGPVLERTWAERSGLGWVGKNSLVLRRDLGSWFFLGVVITTVELQPDEPIPDHCGSCTACIDACPTAAIVEPKVVDANRCISYHTIENSGEPPPQLAAKFGEWVFGCDICQDVCPWNRFATPTSAEDFIARPGQAFPNLSELTTIQKEDFISRFNGTPLRRAGAENLRRYAGLAENAAVSTAMRNKSETGAS